MTDQDTGIRNDGYAEARHGGPRRAGGGSVAPWSFVYGFFSNGTPFDAPNRSETCPRS